MKKTKGMKENILLSIGIVLVSTAYLLKDIINTNICEFITGFGFGIEIVATCKILVKSKK